MSMILTSGQIPRTTAFISATKGSDNPKSDSKLMTAWSLLVLFRVKINNLPGMLTEFPT